jgi:hypothetical protein
MLLEEEKPMEDLAREIYNLMVEVRPYVEARIEEWMGRNPGFARPPEGVPLTTGFCRGVAAGVAVILAERYPECFWRVAGGFGIEYGDEASPDLVEFVDGECFPGGMVNGAGEWHGHFWVTGGDPDSDEGLIVDLSADQFGHGPVVVTQIEDPRYRENSLLGTDDMIRPSERAWGMQLYAMWALGEKAHMAGMRAA